MASPVIPPRPQRAQPGPVVVTQATPEIPPRPSRKHDPSPAREMARSPLNDLPPTAMSNGAHSFYGQSNLSASELPRRPPSVASLPMVGQEGSEYASYDQLPPEAHGVKVQTRHADVPMHAPTASVPASTSKSRISAVTRTDSETVAAAGLGKKEEGEPLQRSVSREQGHPLRTKASFSRSSQSLHSAGTPRPPSVHSVGEFEHGIPLIGTQVPMYPNAGDVQAPSPSPFHTTFPAGIGFFNDGSTRAHQRRRSSRQEFGPPGSYGMHGHQGQEPSDQFEREWIAKHPDIAAREGYGTYQPRPPSALTSDQLNRLVREGDDVGFATNRSMVGTPDQEIGYLASEEYASRMSSAKPSPISATEPSRKRASSGAQAAVESPLRKSFPFSQIDQAVDNDDDVIHVNPPQPNHSTGFEPDGAIDLGASAGNTSEKGGWFDERGSGIPILASDEISKRPGSAYLQPAVNPDFHRDDDDVPPSRRGSMQHGSRPSSRPSSTHGHHAFGGPLARFVSHDEHHGSGVGTPLEEIEEYEPLFPEDDPKGMSKLIKEKLKQRPGLAAHHFPSQDVWEDTPDSLQFTTNVETPEPEHTARAAQVFETPEQEQKRRDLNPEGMTSDSKTFVKPHFKSGVQQDIHRPGIQRFPSSDVWEDTPDSMRLETTVSSAEDPGADAAEEEEPPFHPDPRRTQQIPSRPQSRSKLSQDISSDIIDDHSDPRARDVPDLGASKPKPVVPARPARFSHSDQAAADAGAKPKPAVPARPAGGKLAGLRANFMNDLNSRLQLGPQAPPTKSAEPEQESVEEKAPLADARKGRAKGPARRKPAASGHESFGFSFSSVTLWHIDEEDELKIGNEQGEAKAAAHEPAKAATAEEPQAEPGFTVEQIGAEGDVPEPTISAQVVSEAKAVQPELEKALAGAEPPAASAEALHEKDAAAHASVPVSSGKTVHDSDPLEVRAPEDGNVAIRDGEEVGRTD